MGHGRAKSTGLGVIRWTVKAILCSTALIGLVIGYSILGAFLFRAVENNFSIQNAHQSRQHRETYLTDLSHQIQKLCGDIATEKRRQLMPPKTSAATSTDASTASTDNSTTTDTSTSQNALTNSTLLDNSNNETATTERPTTTQIVPTVTLPDICTNTTRLMNEELRTYEDQLTTQRGWSFDFRDGDKIRQKWSFAEALLFSVTVMTTIGYGNLVPKTFWGRIATMIYAMFGIPLMLLCLAYIGNIWANVLRLIYTAFYRCCQRCKRANKRKTGKMDVSGKKGAAKNDKSNGAIDPEIAAAQTEPENEEINVPAWLAFLILVSYIGGGAVLFKEWETWSYPDSIYFCFITFSTIGFGDLVPGDKSISEQDPERAATCAIYILFGLATMSMVISVIQEDVIRVVYKLGSKIGLNKKTKKTSSGG